MRPADGSAALTVPPSWLTRSVRIGVVGAGGTGSQFVDALASLDATLRRIGHPGFDVTVFDHDRVSNFNLGRQRFTAADVGLNKAVVLVHRVNLFHSLAWKAAPYAARAPQLGAFDLVVTCVDTGRFRAAVGRYFRHRTSETLWLDTGNSAREGQVLLGHLGRTPGAFRIPNIADLYPDLETAADDDAPSCSTEEAITRQEFPINRMVANAAVELLWTLLRKGTIRHHGYRLRLNPLRFETLAIDALAWSFYGYRVRRERTPAAAPRRVQEAA